MSSVLTRNLRSMKILQKHNFSEEEAQEVLDTLQGFSATKEDLDKTESRLEKQIEKVENSLKNEILNNKIEITSIKTELKEDIHTLDKKIDSVKYELKEDIHTLDKKIDQVASTLKDKISQSASSQIKWMFGMLFTILIAIVGLLKL